tara:strand:- start:1234 stop:1743 length:510 start_codon:yes stop_codon:yes gene_type:complete
VLTHNLVSEVQQVALVVRDLKSTLQEYTEKLGIGPWKVMICEPPKLTGTRIRGNPVAFTMKIAFAWTGTTMWEIIEPISGPSIYEEFLDNHGEGLHHLLINHEDSDFTTMLSTLSERGCPPLMEGCLNGVDFAYIESESSLKTTLEVVNFPSGYTPPPPDYWYPEEPAN